MWGFVSISLVNRFVSISGEMRKKGWFPVLLVLLVIMLLIQIIRLVWTIVTPLGPVGDWQSNEVQVMPPQSRLSLFSSFDPFFRDNPDTSTNVVTSLQLTLYGIRQNMGSGLGSAILAGPDGVQESYAVGDEIQSGVTLDTVNFDHVVLDRGGVKETLYLDQSVPAETVGTEEPAPSPILPRPTSEAAANPSASAIAGAVMMQPRSFDGKITGIVVSPEGDGALFKAAGFRDGDIITSVNGKQITSTADIDALKSQIKPGARISVDVERGANTLPISLNVPGE